MGNTDESRHNSKIRSRKRDHRGDFDRDYGLNDLLSIPALDDLCGEIQEISPVPVGVFRRDGSLFFVKGPFPENSINAIGIFLKRDQIESLKTLETVRGKITLFPIIHELETIGYQAVCHEVSGEAEPYPVIPLGNLLLKAITHLIIHTYKYELTAGLHGQVVEDSYARLKETAVLLEKSEQKYRKLAQNLEKEVQKKAQQIKAAQAQLLQHEKMASIGHLAAGVAHEINNPMGFVSSNLNALGDYEKDISALIGRYRSFLSGLKDAMASEDRSEIMEGLECISEFEKEADIDFLLEDIPNLIEESLEGATRIKKIVIDLKDFSHPGEHELQFADVNKGFDSTLNVVWNEIKYKATITKNYGDVPLVKCYPQQLNQVFMNILVNAAQAMVESGKITVETVAEHESVKVIISDTGEGIAKDNLSKIFDPFFTTKEVGKGTGLGLNVAYNIIKKHNGTIDVESSEGKGTTFSISLPVDGPQAGMFQVSIWINRGEKF